jgi:Fe2+ or Zn2+ uptake regulation protein
MTMPQDEAQVWARPIRIRSTIPASHLDELILSALRTSSVPLSAYRIADRLHDHGHRVVIPSIYRSLRRLSDKGTIEKVEMLSAYRIAEGEKQLRLVCQECGRTITHSIPELYDVLVASARRTGFDIAKVALEMAGRCSTCREQER